MSSGNPSRPATSDSVVANPHGAKDLEELRSRTQRLEVEVRRLSDVLGSVLDLDEDSDPTLIEDGRGVDPIYESERAAICRAAGMERQALHHAIRAAESLRAAGCVSEARDALAQSSAGLDHLDADSLELLSQAWERIAMDARAAASALDAAEQHRVGRRFDRALLMCRRAKQLRPETDDLHRCWGLTMLADGEPAGAMGHLMLWVDETGGEPIPRIWHAQALFEMGAEEATRAAVEELMHAIGVGSDPGMAVLPEEIGRQLRVAGARATYFPDVPFWESNEFGEGRASHFLDPGYPKPPESTAENSTETGSNAPNPRERIERSLSPRVFVANNVWFQRAKLSEILADEGVEVLYCTPLDGVMERLSREVLPIDLILYPFSSATESDLEMIAKIRELPRLQDVPILGVSTIERAGLDFDRLRLLGVIGLIDRNALPEHVAFRVNNVVRKDASDGRRFARAPAFFAVDLECEGAVTCEYATNLSCGGLRIASSRPIAKGTDVTVRFRLPSASGSLIEAHGHVVWTGRTQRSDMPRHLIGVFFEPLEAEAQDRVSREVETILSLSDW